ncbi:carboxyl transferase domain-containing protein [Entomospira entomophila]|uniref:ATP-grasp domain-containing protein n=1 Tax=Entomospira entomophila TaxID=2719988 RepID=A0A968GA55_9SPIO|nr:carboxyl transferase domain-containing protein [Entomospira entomophilus]NIZ40732.1 ATP-grasp domain-containing protein [Entomospira entomophilus]WDI34945.1 carboxyl transferase domain-containing protein [Entomospira entomophilus]
MILEDGALIGVVNRGEAAMRFMRALKEYNFKHKTSFKSVAFYVEEEVSALFVQAADYAYPLSSFGTFSKTDTPYLMHDLLLHALTSSGCNAVWAGWGFVSEDTQFVFMLEQAGIVFLGPSAASMSSLGDKINSKALAMRSQVAVTPWSEEPIHSLEHAYEWAEKIGYPVILKASNAGGGRGIRFVWNKDSLEQAYHSTKDETKRITGTEIFFMERLVPVARHFEVQALGDCHGNVKTFGVRDCSIQRKNQKIIEETPPVHVDSALLDEMEASAKRLLEQAQYTGAGTVEFIYDVERGAAYFMEVNARLQVEHTITEELYQIDLVASQIDIARGLSIEEYQYTARGHVMELRLNAEDALQDFKPAPGYVRHFSLAAGLGVRIDSGVASGSTIPAQFDSMIAKIIVRGKDREEALARLERAIHESFIAIKGGTTNRLFALELLHHPQVIAGGVSTRFVEELLEKREFSPAYATHALLVVAAENYLLREEREEQIFAQEVRLLGQPREVKPLTAQSIVLTLNKQRYELEVRALSSKLFSIKYLNRQYLYTYHREMHQRSVLGFAGETLAVQVSASGMLWRIEVGNIAYLVDSDSYGVVAATSPGVILNVLVKEGDLVDAGAPLLYMEAMKMEMPIYAPMSGRVSAVMVDAGEQVMAGSVLVKLEESDDDKNRSIESEPVNYTLFDVMLQENPHSELEVQALMSGHIAKKHLEKYLQAEVEFLSMSLPYYVLTTHLFSHDSVAGGERLSFREGFLRLLRGLPYDEAPSDLQFIIDQLVRLYDDYSHRELDYNTILSLGRRLYHANAHRAEQEKLLQHLLVHIKEVDADVNRDLVDWLQAVVSMNNGLSTVAQDFIYHHFTKHDLKCLATDKVVRFQRVFDLMHRHPRHKHELMHMAINYGPASELELFMRANGGAQEYLSMEILVHKLYLNRNMRIGFYRPRYFEFEYTDYDGTVVTAALVVYLKHTDVREVLKSQHISHVLFMNHSQNKLKERDLQQSIEEDRASMKVRRISVLSADLDEFAVAYHHYQVEGGTFHEDNVYRDINPFHFHQLRLHRLSPFFIEHYRLSSTMGLIVAQAKEDPKDERFILYMSIEALRPLRQDKVYLLGLEESLSEGVFALRQAQLRRKKRLYWNRVLIFVQQPIDSLSNEIGNYALELSQKLLDTELGIERVSLYVNHQQGRQEEITLTSSGTLKQMQLMSRTPKEEPLKLQTRYDSKVMRAHARGVFYPYELICFLQNGDFGIPKAEFIEYDLVDESSYEIEIVKREPAHNQANVILGLIMQEVDGVVYKRVILLSDPTQDMGSLAEPEARRVIAALNMAEAMNLPVEWLPLSSGAKITLDSGTENLDWTAATLRRIIEFTQAGGEINIIVSGVNVGAQSYWNAEATMLMHTRGLLIMTESGSMLLTGKRALDFAGSVSARDNLGIGGAHAVMLPNGQAQMFAPTLKDAYRLLLQHYTTFYAGSNGKVAVVQTNDDPKRDMSVMAYEDAFESGFKTIGDIFSETYNADRKKPFSMRQVMASLCDHDTQPLERMAMMANAQGVIVWQARIGGYACGLIGIESHSQTRHGQFSSDGPSSYAGGTLYPMGSKKLARAVNIFSQRVPLVILANLSGFDGSPESLRLKQLEWGAEIGRAIVNFKGPILFVVTSRYHGGAYVVFSKMLNSNITTYALEGSFASVIGGAPAAAVVFPALVAKRTIADPRWVEAQRRKDMSASESNELYQEIYLEKQQELAVEFDQTHNIQRAKDVGSIDEIIKLSELREKVTAFISQYYQE